MRPGRSFPPSSAPLPPRSQFFRPDPEASESAHRQWMKMEYLLLLERKLDDLVVIAGDGDGRRATLDQDQLRAGRELQRVGERAESGSDLIVGLGCCKARFLTHRVLELIEAEISLAEVDGEIGADGEN